MKNVITSVESETQGRICLLVSSRGLGNEQAEEINEFWWWNSTWCVLSRGLFFWCSMRASSRAWVVYWGIDTHPTTRHVFGVRGLKWLIEIVEILSLAQGVTSCRFHHFTQREIFIETLSAEFHILYHVAPIFWLIQLSIFLLTIIFWNCSEWTSVKIWHVAASINLCGTLFFVGFSNAKSYKFSD